jgi:hypothetical protein
MVTAALGAVNARSWVERRGFSTLGALDEAVTSGAK